LPDIKKYDNLATIQVLIFIKETLSEYYKKVKNKKDNVLTILNLCVDFNDCCPLCGGKDCAKFMGYFHRKAIDGNGTYYKEFPIARFLCHNKGNKKGIRFKTFSLLPYQLVPYSKYSIPFIIKLMKARHIKGMSIYKVQEYMDAFCEGEILSTGSGQLAWFKQLFTKLINKLIASGYYQLGEIKRFWEEKEQDLLKGFLQVAESFECFKVEPHIRGPCAFNYDFYLTGGGYFRNAYFLFGTPSQFRKR